MKEKSLLFGIAVFLCTLASISNTQAETLSPIIISEIQITGGTGHTDDDFIELYNPNPKPVNISGYRIRYKNSSGTENSLKEIDNNICIASQSYYLWANNKYDALKDIANTKTGVKLAPNYSLALLLPRNLSDMIIDSVSWGSESHPFNSSDFHFTNNPGPNESMARYVVTENWLSDFSKSPTPTKSTDTSCPAETPQPTPDPIPSTTPSSIRINEIFPNPKEKGDAGEFVELYNFGTDPVDISGWILRDATKTGKYVFPSDTVITASTYFVVTDQNFKLSLNNFNETISLFDKNEKLIDSAHYEKTKNNVSLNYTAASWRGGIPTPGAENQLNNLPKTSEKVPKKGYRGVPVMFNAKGKDIDGDTLKYTWNFGDDHKSYKAKTSHKYEQNGIYTVTLTTTDGSDDVIETFTLKIESYHYPKIRITSFAPNPAGNDTDNEWIMLENKSKKKINLKGFGIATGWKNLVNHPIREDFIIEPKQETKMTREYSLFTLPNQKGKIELRAPNGKVLQKIKYKLDKSIAEEAVYRKNKGERWHLEETIIEESDDTNTKNILSESENNGDEELPPVSNDTDTNAPLEKNEGENSDSQETESIVLGASTITKTDEEIFLIQQEHNKKWLALINIGTQINVPENVTFAPNNKRVEKPQESEHYAVSFAREAFSEINNSLNNMLNASQN